jgi:23S rRNA C2498 (ribose-2'-O)-methylase RlmM
MKKVKAKVAVNCVAGYEEEEIMTFPDDATEEEIMGEIEAWANDCVGIEYWYEEVDEDDDDET